MSEGKSKISKAQYIYTILIFAVVILLIASCEQGHLVNDYTFKSEKELSVSMPELIINDVDNETSPAEDDDNYIIQTNEDVLDSDNRDYDAPYDAYHANDTLDDMFDDTPDDIFCVVFSHPTSIQSFDEYMQAEINRIAARHSAIGVQIAVVREGEVAYTHEFGYAVMSGTLMTSDNKIRSASLTKPILAILAVKLHEIGEIDIDADISEYWGIHVRNPNHRETPITIRQIISHTSSIDERRFPYATSEAVHFAEFNAGSIFTSSRPGSIGSWFYSNFAYAVLGITLEVATGETVNDLANRLLFHPLDIDAAFGAGSVTNTDLVAALYRQGGRSARTIETQLGLPGSTYPGETGVEFAGGLTISAVDFAKLLAALIGQGEYGGVRILSPESVSMIESSQGTVGGFNQSLSMRHRENMLGQEELFWHTGTAWGVVALASYNPITGNGIVIITTGANNSRDGHGLSQIGAEISRVIYDYLGS